MCRHRVDSRLKGRQIGCSYYRRLEVSLVLRGKRLREMFILEYLRRRFHPMVLSGLDSHPGPRRRVRQLYIMLFFGKEVLNEFHLIVRVLLFPKPIDEEGVTIFQRILSSAAEYLGYFSPPLSPSIHRNVFHQVLVFLLVPRPLL